jgi:DNA-binding winged helix-turn-helix (wHTH) protein/tetratricopeptide (TPR) repeat protein
MIDVPPSPPCWVYEFGHFRLDPAREVLTHGSTLVDLPGRLFTILITLLEADGAVVNKDRLQELLRVTQHGLSQHVYMLRRILRERARDEAHVKTVHNRGYRFSGHVRKVSPNDSKATLPVSMIGGKWRIPSSRIEALGFYAVGSLLLERGSAGAILAARKHFDSALKAEPCYAPALLGMGRAYLLQAQNGYSPCLSDLTMGEHAVSCALREYPGDPILAAAHAVLSNLIILRHWNLEQAQQQLDLAIRMNATCHIVRVCAFWLYMWSGRPDKASEEARNALEDQPSSFPLQLLLARSLIASGDYEAALWHLSIVVDGDRGYAEMARTLRAGLALDRGQPQQAMEDLSKVEERGDDVAHRLPLLARACAEQGDEAMARRLYDALINLATTQYIPNSRLVPVALALGRRRDALTHLARAIVTREPGLLVFRYAQWFRSVCATEGFRQLAATSNLV